MKWLSLTDTPRVQVNWMGDREMAQRMLSTPYTNLPPNDIATLEADPFKRQRYIELVKYTWLPPLQLVAELNERKVCWQIIMN